MLILLCLTVQLSVCQSVGQLDSPSRSNFVQPFLYLVSCIPSCVCLILCLSGYLLVDVLDYIASAFLFFNLFAYTYRLVCLLKWLGFYDCPIVFPVFAFQAVFILFWRLSVLECPNSFSDVVLTFIICPCSWFQVVIRVKFPDRLIIQGIFRPRERGMQEFCVVAFGMNFVFQYWV